MYFPINLPLHLRPSQQSSAQRHAARLDNLSYCRACAPLSRPFFTPTHHHRHHHHHQQTRVVPPNNCNYQSPTIISTPSKNKPRFDPLGSRGPKPAPGKLASGAAPHASANPGALPLFQNITASLASYADYLSDTLAESSEYLQAQGLSSLFLYSTLACITIALGMSRFYAGSSSWGGHHHSASARDGLSPFASQVDQSHGGIPRVTDDDFSYITSEDLEDSPSTAPPKNSTSTQHGSYMSSSRAHHKSNYDDLDLEDDVLLIKNRGQTGTLQFPAFAIGDGKLRVRDVRERVGTVNEVPERRRHRIKMLYKGRQLKDPDAPIRGYGVKNNSEILVVLPEGESSGLGVSDAEEEDEEEEVVVGDDYAGEKTGKSKRRKVGKKHKSNRSPRDSSLNLADPSQQEGGEAGRSSSETTSSSLHAAATEKLGQIRSHFNTKLLPLCVEFSAHPPGDEKKREDEHRRLSETIMQEVLLKLDEVETGGDDGIRKMRKELIRQVQDVLKGIDSRVPTETVGI